MATGYQSMTEDVRSPLITWSAIFGGLVLGLATLVLLTALWLALAYGSNMTEVSENLEWYIGISAIASLFLAGIVTGYLSGVHGAGTGMLHGSALWGLLILVTLTVGIPSVSNVFGLQQIADQAIDGRLIGTNDEGALWAAFWTILGGFAAAGFGGMIGGLSTRRGVRSTVSAVTTPPADDTTRVVVPGSRADDDVMTTTVRR